MIFCGWGATFYSLDFLNVLINVFVIFNEKILTNSNWCAFALLIVGHLEIWKNRLICLHTKAYHILIAILCQLQLEAADLHRQIRIQSDTGIHSNIASCFQSLIYLQDGALECFCVCGTVSVIYKYFHSPPRQILLLLPILPWFSLLHCAHNSTHLLFIHIRMYGARQIKPEIAHYHSVLRF